MGYRGERQLTKEQHNWIDGWLNLWGAWVHSGRLDVSHVNMIYKFMASVEPISAKSRPMCNDDEGMLISQVVDAVISIDKEAYSILLSYYAHGASKLSISTYLHEKAKPRLMQSRGGNKLRKPSLMSIRREVTEKLEASLYLLHEPLKNAMNSLKRAPIINEKYRNALTNLNN
ncbi:antiterminator Q family protein [Xenorhabdus budapestensis]|uniref:Antiterminator n=1 Tax=Xenorhabdus budapestensis TaxID=290110 RepID=A0ABX7VM41_XENBU|nr:antiterminator Q family protein [Xenorhabdus budapestensis]QTL40580.1 antiterminator [Xenorhabdus budapestensis]